MDLPRNTFKHALAGPRPLIGLWASLAHHYATEVVAGAGFDWLVIDAEHSPNDIDALLTQLLAVQPYPTHAVVRVPANDAVTIKRVLDIGALTLLVPQVNTAEEARAAVAATRYPPQGIRGYGGTTRATRFARVANYAQRAHEEIGVIVQAESATALDNLEAIAAVDGIDGIFIGPADLHASLGHAGETRHPDVMPIIDQAIRRIVAAGRAAGILTGIESDARRWIELGARFVAVGADIGILARGAAALAAQFKGKPAA